jgi:hypothetical protein
MAECRLRTAKYVLPASGLGPENPFPAFRAVKKDNRYRFAKNVPLRDRSGFGRESGFRVLPYRMQDDYTPARNRRTFRSIVLENRFLRATFLPEMGGRMVSLVDLTDHRELLFHNPAIKLANVALRNAWFAGGVEWNLGHLGHHFLTSAPVYAARIGGSVLRLYEWDRLKGLAWQIDFHLPARSRFLFARVRVVNPTPREASMYWWTNIAVPEAPDIRVLAPASQAFLPDWKGRIGFNPLPQYRGADLTYATRSKNAYEAFFRIQRGQRPWVAALGKDGRGLVQTSTARLKGRKLFAWGSGPGGRRWQGNLSLPGRAYIEIQAGLAPTQMQTLPMPAGAVWEWTEAFGHLTANPEVVHGSDWEAAWHRAGKSLDGILSAPELDRRHEEFAAVRDRPPDEILSAGSGWGALERRRKLADGERDDVPAALEFPRSSLGSDQEPWLELLEAGTLPVGSLRNGPGQYMIQPEWERRLELAIKSGRSRHWLALLHLGIMRAERFDLPGARAAWRRSIASTPTSWALRNLARFEKSRKRAVELVLKAWKLAPGFARPALAVEAIEILTKAGQGQRALKFIRSLPPRARVHERVRIAEARLSLKYGRLDSVERILKSEFITVREGEMGLTELWFAMWEKRLARRGPVTREIRERVRRDYPPPASIDYRHD